MPKKNNRRTSGDEFDGGSGRDLKGKFSAPFVPKNFNRRMPVIEDFSIDGKKQGTDRMIIDPSSNRSNPFAEQASNRVKINRTTEGFPPFSKLEFLEGFRKAKT